LVVDDDERDRTLLAGMISSLGYRVETAVDGEDALAKLDQFPISLILTDLMMPKVDGFGLLKMLAATGHNPPVIVLTAVGSIEDAVSVVHDMQAFWFLEKPPQLGTLETLIHRALQHNKLMRETERLQRELSYQGVLGDLVGKNQGMRHLFSLIQKVAPTQASVLITGESGTGKEMVARAIHQYSSRANGRFVPINCAALPQELIESELFGYEKGAFTGAMNRHAGCFEQADGGTLFLDEIADMPMVMQARLLRVLEESKVRRLGGTGEIAVDVRVLAATNRRVEDADRASLREDLYYRLNVFRIHLPPLRERKDDIALLAQTIISKLNEKHGAEISHLHPDTLEKLEAHSWPGNVRELRNVLEWAVITSAKGAILPEHLPKSLTSPSPSAASHAAVAADDPKIFRYGIGCALEDLEEAYIRNTLNLTSNNRKEAARLLGISLRTLYNRLAKFSATEAAARFPDNMDDEPTYYEAHNA
jgi:DNA-binding NtrC family response regulator